MKKLLIIFFLFVSAHAWSQNNLIWGKSVEATRDFTIKNKKVTDISEDSTAASKDANKLITERAAKLYADLLRSLLVGGSSGIDSFKIYQDKICTWRGGDMYCNSFLVFLSSIRNSADSNRLNYYNFNGDSLGTVNGYASMVDVDYPITKRRDSTGVWIFGLDTSYHPGGGVGSGISALTGDVAASGVGSVAATLATVNSNIGSWNHVTINAKGLATAGSNVAYIVPADTSFLHAQVLANTAAILGKTDKTTTLAINGIAFDLSSNRAWTVGTVTSIGLTSSDITVGGTSPITNSGSYTLTLPTVNSNVGSFTNATVTVNAKGLVTAVSSGTGGAYEPIITPPNSIKKYLNGYKQFVSLDADSIPNAVTLTGAQTLTNKILTSPQLNSPLLNTTSIVGYVWSATNTTGAGGWAANPGWAIGGNTGTDSSVNGIGTNDNKVLAFRVNGKNRGALAYSSFSFGNLSGIVSGQWVSIDSAGISFNTNGSSASKLKFSGVVFTPVYNSSGTDILTSTKTTQVNTTKIFAGNVATQYESLTLQGACLGCESLILNNSFSSNPKRLIVYEASGAPAVVSAVPSGDGSFIVGGINTDAIASALVQFKSTSKGAISSPVMTSALRKIITTVIVTGSISAPGTGYTNGTYTATALTNVSSGGSTATATIVVSGNIVTGFTIVSGGINYRVGDVLSATIPGGSGFTYTVATTTGTAGISVYDSDYGNVFYYNGLDWGMIPSYIVKNVSTTYTVLKTDEKIIATSGTFTITLPSPVGLDGKEFTIINSGTGAITLSSSALINGLSTYGGLSAQYKYVRVTANNSTYSISSNN